MAGKPKGFAAMNRNEVSEIARKGGKAAHIAGTAHEFTSEAARLAGAKGGRATHANRKLRLTEKGMAATDHVVQNAPPLPEPDESL